MSYLIVDASNAIVAGPVDQEPTLADAQRAVVVPLGYGVSMIWSVGLGGFVDVVPDPLISVGRFMLLFTQPERIALRAAAAQDPHVEDFVDLLRGFTDGVSLSDPVLIGAIGQLRAGGLLTADRAAAILAGTPPT